MQVFQERRHGVPWAGVPIRTHLPKRPERDAGSSSSADEVLRTLSDLGAPLRPVFAGRVELMLAQQSDRPFSAKGWIFELKHDGFRLLAARESGECRLFYRRGGDASRTFPEVKQALVAIPFEDCVLDGELVVLDEEGRSSFQSLQKRFQLLRASEIEQAARAWPATLFVFDLIALAGYDLRPLPLLDRKRILRSVVPDNGGIRYADHIEERGEEFYEEVRKRQLEGIVAKRADSPYRGGRSLDWLKLRVDRVADFVVVGFTEPQGGRPGFGALHLGWFEDGRLTYAGRVGGGFDHAELIEVRAALQAIQTKACPCEGAVPTGAAHSWVEPRLVCEVRYKEWTEVGLLRQPVFLRFRVDKGPQECLREMAAPPPSD
jgi:bifunctional non-homologous end joining protein LigD